MPDLQTIVFYGEKIVMSMWYCRYARIACMTQNGMRDFSALMKT